jgi:hypothetical protein
MFSRTYDGINRFGMIRYHADISIHRDENARVSSFNRA